jgi:hypothetical protein
MAGAHHHGHQLLTARHEQSLAARLMCVGSDVNSGRKKGWSVERVMFPEKAFGTGVRNERDRPSRHRQSYLGERHIYFAHNRIGGETTSSCASRGAHTLCKWFIRSLFGEITIATKYVREDSADMNMKKS